jgi:hypothetical protein
MLPTAASIVAASRVKTVTHSRRGRAQALNVVSTYSSGRAL